jgi:hypothetical protein
MPAPCPPAPFLTMLPTDLPLTGAAPSPPRVHQADIRMIELMQKYGITKTQLSPLKTKKGQKYVGTTSLSSAEKGKKTPPSKQKNLGGRCY